MPCTPPRTPRTRARRNGVRGMAWGRERKGAIVRQIPHAGGRRWTTRSLPQGAAASRAPTGIHASLPWSTSSRQRPPKAAVIPVGTRAGAGDRWHSRVGYRSIIRCVTAAGPLARQSRQAFRIGRAPGFPTKKTASLGDLSPERLRSNARGHHHHGCPARLAKTGTRCAAPRPSELPIGQAAGRTAAREDEKPPVRLCHVNAKIHDSLSNS
jgi:hypothetical protein